MRGHYKRTEKIKQKMREGFQKYLADPKRRMLTIAIRKNLFKDLDNNSKGSANISIYVDILFLVCNFRFHYVENR